MPPLAGSARSSFEQLLVIPVRVSYIYIPLPVFERELKYYRKLSPLLSRAGSGDPRLSESTGPPSHPRKFKEVYTRPLRLTSCQEDRLGLDYTVLCLKGRSFFQFGRTILEGI